VQRRTVDVLELARRGGSVEGQIEAAELARLAPALAAPAGRIGYRLDGLIDEHGRSAASLHLEGRLQLRCDLCGQPLEWALDETERFFFVDEEAQLGELPITTEGAEPLLASRAFDLTALVEDQAILALPISPRHPQCEGSARDQAQPETNRPFAALASLRRGRTDIQ
jgi:uncharacterized protein